MLDNHHDTKPVELLNKHYVINAYFYMPQMQLKILRLWCTAALIPFQQFKVLSNSIVCVTLFNNNTFFALLDELKSQKNLQFIGVSLNNNTLYIPVAKFFDMFPTTSETSFCSQVADKILTYTTNNHMELSLNENLSSIISVGGDCAVLELHP